MILWLLIFEVMAFVWRCLTAVAWGMDLNVLVIHLNRFL